MALAPIWRDYTVTLDPGTARTFVDFEIRTGGYNGTTIYAGRAHQRPGVTPITARINDVCADYISTALPNLGGFTSLDTAETFYVVAFPAGVQTSIDSVTFYNDWSYDPDFNPNTMPLADPVRATLDPRQWLFFSVLPGPTDITAVLTFQDGTTATVVVPVIRTADFSADFNADFAIEERDGGGGTAVLDLSAFSGLVSVTVEGVTYEVLQEACSRFAAYYVNAYGGWDSLLLEGKDLRRDELTRHTYRHDYDNADPAARGTKDYAIEVSPAWTLNTGLLTDDESSRMHHLLNSTEVYLCELATGRLFPVVLTDTETPHRRYADERRPVQYAFNATLARERFRR